MLVGMYFQSHLKSRSLGMTCDQVFVVEIPVVPSWDVILSQSMGVHLFIYCLPDLWNPWELARLAKSEQGLDQNVVVVSLRAR